MKKIIFILIVILFFIDYSANSQTSVAGNNEPGIGNISQEKIFVHHNTSFLLTGEYLYYKVYCLNTETNNLSNFSKIAYVELINSKKETVFKHKIILKKGMGYGDYFIPTSLSSGNYKLVSYTQWMRNGEISNFYQNSISIINPFQENQKSILNDGIISKNDFDTESFDYNKSNQEHHLTNNYIDLQLNSKNYSNREKVSLKMHTLKGDLSFGNYSISVRKIDNLKIPARNTSFTYIGVNKKPVYVQSVNVKYLPELRGELLTGKVLLEETGLPVKNIKVALSIPGGNSIFKIANTNSNGIYYFNIKKEYDNKNATIQIIDTDKNKYKLIINKQLPIEYKNIEFYDFKITSAEKELILNHSISNQIENAYARKKSDSIKSLETISPFYHNKAKEYLLDDYTRFKTLKETFVEIIPEIYSRQKKGQLSFYVRIFEKEIESGLIPLVIIDGNLVQDHTKIADFDTNRIKTISVVSEMYMYGSKLFEGVISINTFKGDYKNPISTNAIKNIKLSKPLAHKQYFNQTYNNTENSNRIPDYRRQLLWNPDFTFDKSEKIIDFYTSDVNGDFEICLEGFTSGGEPVTIRKVIHVGNNTN